MYKKTDAILDQSDVRLDHHYATFEDIEFELPKWSLPKTDFENEVLFGDLNIKIYKKSLNCMKISATTPLHTHSQSVENVLKFPLH